jgi:excisionase family DNA binding protein
MASTVEYLTLTEVAERMGVAKMTVRRYLDAGRFPNAIRQDGRKDGLWLLPMGDVTNSGIGRRYRHSPAPENSAAVATGSSGEDLAGLVETVRSQARTIEQLTALVAQLTKGGQV